MNQTFLIMEILFATANQHKFDEAKAILGNKFTLIMPKELGFCEDIEETGETLEENSFLKCQASVKQFGRECFADDTGLEVEALNGAPGVYSARYANINSSDTEHYHQKNMLRLLDEMEKIETATGIKNRKARFRTIITLYFRGEYYTFEGIVNGVITYQMVGTNGFGYDPVFRPDGYDCTIAQMSNEQKNSLSHRGMAMRKLADFLNQQC